jgi:Tfp pilus assembly protein PilN
MPSTTVQIRAEDKTKAAFRQINERTQKLKKSFGGLAGAAVSLAGIGGLGALTSKLLTLGDRIGKVSIQTGVSAEKLQAFQFAAEQSGVGAELMNKSLQKLNRNIGEAADGTGPAADALDSLGISALTSSGQIKSTEVIFQDIASAFGDVESDAMKAKIASDLFGRAGIELIPLLSAGADGVDKFGKQLESVGGVIDEESIQSIQNLNDKINLLSKSFTGFLADSGTFKFFGEIIDGWTFGVKKLNNLFGDQEKKVRDINTVSQDLKLARKETALFQMQIEKSTGNERDEAIKRLQTNQKQIKALQAELLKSEKIEGSVKDQEKAQKQVTKAIKATDKVAKDLKQTVKPLMIAGKLDVPAIGGRQGLGGTLEKFTQFYLNLMTLAEDYLGTSYGVAAIAKKHLETIRQDFSEMITGLQNQLVFQRNDISNAFANILADFERELQETKIDVENINIEIPSSAFDFTNTFAKVPGEIFDFSAVMQATGAIDSLVKQINSYSVTSRTVSREAMAVSFAGRGAKPYWSNANLGNMQNLKVTGRNDLKFDVPSISTSESFTRTSGRSSMSSGSSALTSTNNPSITVNIYDGTGRRISEYDSAIRVEINERASRFNEFPALAA